MEKKKPVKKKEETGYMKRKKKESLKAKKQISKSIFMQKK